MVTIVTRAGKGSALTNAEVDANFNNLNTGKLEITSATGSAKLPVGTTAQRDAATVGYLRWNSNLGYVEVSDGAIWEAIDANATDSTVAMAIALG